MQELVSREKTVAGVTCLKSPVTCADASVADGFSLYVYSGQKKLCSVRGQLIF